MFLNVRIVRILYIVCEKRRVPLVVLELLILPEHVSSSPVLMRFVLLSF